MEIYMINLNIKKGPNALGLPFYATIGSAGMDLQAAIQEDIIIKQFDRKIIETGIFIELEPGFEAQVRPRSGLAFKNGVTVLNSPGTIDSDYRGEIKVILINLGQDDFVVKRGDRIAQLVISRYEQANLVEQFELEETTRGSSGFGSTGL
jgi:dUTP pyrophosphatase